MIKEDLGSVPSDFKTQRRTQESSSPWLLVSARFYLGIADPPDGQTACPSHRLLGTRGSLMRKSSG